MTGIVTGPELPGLTYVEFLDSGGFSDVFLYERHQPRIKVAVKLMRADVLDETQRRQFVSEADVMAELAEHPFIVPVLGAGTTTAGQPYIVMRYYPPPDLGKRVAASPMSVPDALRTGIQLASAIETAHQAGIIHRDIKPSNVLVSSYGVPGLSDFGIAGRAVDAHRDDNVGVSMPWSPPEVLTGASNGTVVSDVYSLAATIWNLLVGRSPFAVSGDDSERSMFTRILHSRPPSTGRADVPGSLERLLQQAMSKDPGHRPQRALEFARHLQRVEQELRLARTEIVVLEPVAETPLAPAAPDVPASLVEPPAAETQQRPATPVPATSQPTARRTVVVPPDSFGLTTETASQAVVPAADAPPPGAPDLTGLRQERTVRRPTTAPTAEPVELDHSRRRSWLSWAAAAALLTVIVLVGVVLTHGGDSPNVTNDLPNDTTVKDPAAAIGGGTKPSPPDVSATVAKGKAVFTWPREQAGDAYWYEQEGTSGPEPSRSRKIVIPILAGGQVCVNVHVVRGTDPSATNSAKACAP